MPIRAYSSDDNMRSGDLVNTSSITRQIRVGDATLADSFKAPKGQQFVFLYLGYEPKDGSKVLDVIQVMQNLGWTPPPELEDVHQELLAVSAQTEAEVAK
jgi:hypothetical protein